MKFLFVASLVLLSVVPCFGNDDQTVLLPLGLFSVPGAYGSVWQTELATKNASAAEFLIGDISDTCSPNCGVLSIDGRAGATTWFENPQNSPLIDSESGLILHLVSTNSSASPLDMKFNLRVRDMSRLKSTLGTEIPVVRGSDFRTGTIYLLNVPVGDGYRTTVRVYALDEAKTTVNVVARVLDFASQAPLLEVPFELQRARPEDWHWYPLYARLDHLTDTLPPGGSRRVIVEIRAADADQTLWAFASITNNETQQFTVISPE